MARNPTRIAPEEEPDVRAIDQLNGITREIDERVNEPVIPPPPADAPVGDGLSDAPDAMRAAQPEPVEPGFFEKNNDRLMAPPWADGGGIEQDAIHRISSLKSDDLGQKYMQLAQTKRSDEEFERFMKRTEEPVAAGDGMAPKIPAAGEVTRPPGQIEPGNIDLKSRPVVNNPDGSISTVRSMSVGIDGKEVLLPTISDDGQQLTTDQAIDAYRKTGKHLGIFRDAQSADDYARSLSTNMDKLKGADRAEVSSEPSLSDTSSRFMRLASRVGNVLIDPKLPAAVVRDVAVGFTEAPLAMAKGINIGVKEFAQVTSDMADFMDEKFGVTMEPWTDETALARKIAERPLAALAEALPGGDGLKEPTSVTANLIQEVSRFIVGFKPAMIAVKSLGLTSASARAAAAVSATGVRGSQVAAAAISTAPSVVAGGVAELMTKPANDPNIANLLQSVPELQGPVLEFLATNPNDPKVINKLRQGFEGLGMGLLTEPAIAGIRVLLAKKALQPELRALERIHGSVPNSEVIGAPTSEVAFNPSAKNPFVVDMSTPEARAASEAKLRELFPQGSTQYLAEDARPVYDDAIAQLQRAGVPAAEASADAAVVAARYATRANRMGKTAKELYDAEGISITNEALPDSPNARSFDELRRAEPNAYMRVVEAQQTDVNYLYLPTNLPNAENIATRGGLRSGVFSREAAPNLEVAGKPVLLRVKRSQVPFEQRGAGYVPKKPIPLTQLEFLGADGRWQAYRTSLNQEAGGASSGIPKSLSELPSNTSALRSSEIVAPPGDQALLTQVSTDPLPSANSTTRPIAPPSSLDGGTTTRLTDLAIGDPLPNGRITFQGSKDPAAIRALAEETKPLFDADIKSIIDGVDGARPFDGNALGFSRLKTPESLQKKLDAGRPPEGITDYLAGRIVADNEAAVASLVDDLAKKFRVVEYDNKIDRAQMGYRAVHMQVDLGNGMSAEIQIVPKYISEVQEEVHKLYDTFKRVELENLTPDQLVAIEAAKARTQEIFDEAWEKQLKDGWSQVDRSQGGTNNPGLGVEPKNMHGLVPELRVFVPGADDLPPKPLFTQATTNKNAAAQINQIDKVLGKFDDTLSSTDAWSRMMSHALASKEVPVPPYGLINDVSNGGAVAKLKSLSPGQIADADHGFVNAAEFKRAYDAKELPVTTTGKLFLWSFLSRGVSPYVQESMFIDAFKGIDHWIQKAAKGDFTSADFPAYEAWAKTVAPKGSGQPGAGSTHNLNAFGKNFLVKMSERDASGVSHMQRIHDMMSDKDMTGAQIRREFMKVGEGVGIDNKVVSFTILVSGRTDVMVLDRVQLRQMFDDGRFSDRNLYDGVTNENGYKVTGTGLAELTYGARGLLIYEAIERDLGKRIGKIYADAGRPGDASIGRYHWESWVAYSNQEASHGTLKAILSDAKGNDAAIAQVRSKQGEYGAYEYGARYGRDETGQPSFAYTLPSGNEYVFSVPEFRAFLADIKKPATGVRPTNFKVTEVKDGPWYNDPRIDQARLEARAAHWSGSGDAAGEGAAALRRVEQDALASGVGRRGSPGGDAEVRAFNQSRQTDTPEFETWSKGAPVVKAQTAIEQKFETGKPVVVESYHGTNADFEAFDPSARGNKTDAPSAKMGDFSASNPSVASSYADTVNPYNDGVIGKVNKATRGGYEKFNETILGAIGRPSILPEGGNVKPIYVRMDNPFVHDMGGKEFRDRAYADIIAEAKKNGHDGVIIKNTFDEGFSPGGDGLTNVYVSFDPKQIKSATGNRGTFDPNDANILNQLDEGTPQARITLSDNKAVIQLFKGSDESSFMHEAGHLWLDELVRDARVAGAPKQAADDLVETMRWLGVDDIDQIGREQHEKWARGFEQYLRDGSAPSEGLKGVFENFKKWLTQIYRSLTDLGEPLPDSIKGVMDRLLANDLELAVSGKTPFVTDKGMTPNMIKNVSPRLQEAGFDGLVIKGVIGEDQFAPAVSVVYNPSQSAARAKLGAAIEGAGDTGVPTDVVARGITGSAEANAERAGVARVLRAKDDPVSSLDTGQEVYINFSRINAADDVKQVIRDMADAYKGEIDVARRGVQTHEATAKLADDLGMTVEELLSRRKGQVYNAEEMLAARRLLVTSADKLKSLSAVVAQPTATMADQYNFLRMMGTHTAIQQEVAAAQTEIARSLSAMRINAGSNVEMAQHLSAVIENQGGARSVTAMAQVMQDLFAAGVPPGAISAAAKRGLVGTTMDAIRETFTLGLLWNPATHAANFASNTVVSFMNIYERGLAAKIGNFLGTAVDEKVASGEAIAMTYGMVTSFKEAFRLSYRAAIHNEQSAMGGTKLDRPMGAISSEVFSREAGHNAAQAADFADSAYGKAIDFLGTINTIPGRALAAGDEFTKAMVWRSEIHAQSLRMATQEGHTGKELWHRMMEIANDPPSNIRIAANDAAVYSTMQSPMGDGIGAGLVMTRTGTINPIFAILPFVKTPMNILRYTFERTPLAFTVKRWRDDIASGGGRRDLALARMASGTMILMAGLSYASDGFITGPGPSDPAKKDALMRQGWKPNSIFDGETYHSFSRMDPIGMYLSFAGGVSEMMKKSDMSPDDYDDVLEVMAAGAAIIGTTVVEKTWFNSVGRFFDSLQATKRGDKSMERFAGQQLGSMLPLSSAFNVHKRFNDPVQRDINSPWDAVMAKIAGLSERLTPARDVWGKEIEPHEVYGRAYDVLSPIAVSKRTPSTIDAELERLGHGINKIQKKTSFSIDGERVMVDFSAFPKVFDEYVRLSGNELKDPANGKGAKDFLDAVVERRDSQSQVYYLMQDGDTKMSPKADWIRNRISEYRAAAQQKIVDEGHKYPEFIEHVRELAAKQLRLKMPVQ